MNSRSLNTYFNIRRLEESLLRETTYLATEYMPFNTPVLPVLQTSGVSEMEQGARLHLQHPYWSIQFLERGKLTVRCGSFSGIMVPGEVLMMRPGTSFEMENRGRNSVRRRWITVSSSPLLALLCDSSLPVMSPVIHLNEPERLAFLLDEIQEEICRGDKRVHWNLSVKIYAFLVEILSQMPGRAMQSDFEHILYDLQNIFTEKLTLDSMADRYGVTPRTLSRMFRKNMDVSPMVFVINLRIRYACRLLTTTSLSIGQIARHCGYANLSFFARSFQKKMGKTPGAFRESFSGLSQKDQSFFYSDFLENAIIPKSV